MSRQTLLALLMIGLVILFMQTDWYKERAFPQRPVPDSLQTLQKETPPPAVPETAPVPSEMRAQPETTDYVATTLAFAGEDSTEKFVEVLSDLYTARLSTRGGTIVYFGLKKFKSYVGEEVALIDGSDPTLDPVFTVEGGRFRFSDHFMQCDVEHVDLRGAREGRWVNFTLEDSLTHRRIQKSYFFSPQSYYLKAVVETEGFGDGFLYGTYRINWKAPLQITELDTVQDVTYAEAMALMNGRNLDEFMIHKGERQVQTTTGIVDWVAKRNKYFEVAVIPLTRKGSEVTYTGYQHQVNHSKKSNLPCTPI
jgi:YidC/Oxa1 family membrane protein insertase